MLRCEVNVGPNANVEDSCSGAVMIHVPTKLKNKEQRMQNNERRSKKKKIIAMREI